ncbi:MAG TPA: Crp/Fnr family transcriptional regulator [Xanthobacteraceae bacterium]|nr:Crp/Fnr family transcriptional regulator [Xanthobacteraceae bacterium]
MTQRSTTVRNDSRLPHGAIFRGEKLEASGVAALVAALEVRDLLSRDERDAIYQLNWRFRDFARGAEIIRDRSRPTESCLVSAGYAVRAGYLRSGQRQLTSVLVPGDFVDLHGLLLRVMDHSVLALTDCRMAFVDHAALRRLSGDFPHLWRMLALLLAIDASIQRSWLLSIGRRNPSSHLAHLLCELYARLRIVGRADGDEFEFPVSQADLADLLGLSVVHTNRTLQELRALNLVRWRGRIVQVPDMKALANVAEFDPIYLHLEREPR